MQYIIAGGEDMADDTQMMKGILEGCVLTLLKAEPLYGYIVVERLKSYGFDAAEATVYPILIRLEKKGELKYEKRPSNLGPPRKYYELTDKGINALSGFLHSWRATSSLVNNLLKEESI
jgi:PadR family transcriptional regulator PadR